MGEDIGEIRTEGNHLFIKCLAKEIAQKTFQNNTETVAFNANKIEGEKISQQLLTELNQNLDWVQEGA